MFRSCYTRVLPTGLRKSRKLCRIGLLSCGIAAGLAVNLLQAADAPKKGMELQGSWTLIAGEANGVKFTEKQLKNGKLVINGDKYSVTVADMETVTGTEKLDSRKSPKTIDITNANGPDKGKNCLGIYELEGDVFRVTFAPPGKARPSKFVTKPDSGHWMHVWKRVKN